MKGELGLGLVCATGLVLALCGRWTAGLGQCRDGLLGCQGSHIIFARSKLAKNHWVQPYKRSRQNSGCPGPILMRT